MKPQQPHLSTLQIQPPKAMLYTASASDTVQTTVNSQIPIRIIILTQRDQSIMNISQSIISVKRLEEEYVDDSASVLARSFIMNHHKSQPYTITYQEIVPIMRGKIVHSLHAKCSFVLLQNQKLIGVCLNYDITDFKNIPNMPNKLQYFEKMLALDAKLQSGINLDKIKRGEGFYGVFGVMDPDYVEKGHSLKFWWEGLSANKLSGYKYYYSKITNEPSLKMFVKLGAEIVVQQTLENKNLKQKFWVIRLDLRTNFPSFSQLKKMTNQWPKSKL